MGRSLFDFPFCKVRRVVVSEKMPDASSLPKVLKSDAFVTERSAYLPTAQVRTSKNIQLLCVVAPSVPQDRGILALCRPTVGPGHEVTPDDLQVKVVFTISIAQTLTGLHQSGARFDALARCKIGASQ